MKRRDFGKLALLGASAGMLSCVTAGKATQDQYRGSPQKIKAAALKKGDTIGLVAPGSPFSPAVFEKAVRQLTEMGFQIKFADNLHSEYGYVAGRDTERLADLHQMFADLGVQAIWCIRGGYGTTRLLPRLDFELIRKNPKLLIGYSDITALLNAIYQRTGLVGLHGPVAASTMTEYTSAKLREIIFEPKDEIYIDRFESKNEDTAFEPVVIVPGICEGELIGGNISLLAAMAGTDFGIDATGKLLFLEDVGEKPYRLDRMLTQLRQSANLDKAAGIIIGVCNDCEANEGNFSLTMKEMFRDRLGDLGIPVYYGFSFGHIDNMCSLPIGIKAHFNTNSGRLILKEKVVV
jgi:muramoyltetrapeptide carboxypeptidase